MYSPEYLTDALGGDDRRRLLRAHGHRPHLADCLKLRHRDVQERGDRDPDQDDRNGELAKDAGDPSEVCALVRGRRGDGPGGRVVGVRAHADFTMQKVWTLVPVEVRSSLTSPSTVTRHPRKLVLPCATMFAAAEGSVVCNVTDHGRMAPSTRCGSRTSTLSDRTARDRSRTPPAWSAAGLMRKLRGCGRR